MAETVGTVKVLVVPDASGFQTKLKSQVERSSAGVGSSGDRAGREWGDRFSRAAGSRLNNSAAPYIIKQLGTSWLSGTLQSSGFAKSAHVVTAFGAALQQTAVASAAAAVGMGAYGAAVWKALEKTSELEQVQVSMQTLFKTQEEANRMLNESIKFAKDTPFDLTSVTTGIKQLKAYGFAGKDLIPVMTDIGDAAAALGLGAPGVQRLVMAFGQIQARGTFRADEARQLTEAGIPAWKALSKALTEAEGKTVDMQEVMRRAEAGQISAKFALSALRREMQRTYGGGMQAQARTFAGTVEKIKEAFTLNMQKALLPLMPKLADEARSLIGPLSALSRQIGQGLSAGIQGFVTEGGPKFRRAIKDIGPVLEDLLASLGPQFGTILGNLASVLADTAPALAGAAKKFYFVGEAVTRVLEIFAKLPGPVQEAVYVLAGIGFLLGPSIAALAQLAFQLKIISALSAASGAGSAAGGIAPAFSKLGGVGFKVGQLAGTAAEVALNFKAWAPALAGAAGIVAGMVGAVAAISKIADELVKKWPRLQQTATGKEPVTGGSPENPTPGRYGRAGDLEEYKRAIGLTEASLSALTQAESRYSQQLQSSNSVITQRNNGTLRGNALTYGAKIALSNQASAARGLVKSQQQAGMSAQSLMRTVVGQRNAFMRNAVAMGFSKAEAFSMAKAYRLIPKNVLTRIKEQGAKEAEAKIKSITGKIKDLKAQRTAIKVDGTQTKRSQREVENLDRKVKGLRKRRAEIRAEAKNIPETIKKLQNVPKALKKQGDVDFKVIAKTSDADAKIRSTQEALKTLTDTQYEPKVNIQDDSQEVAQNVAFNLSQIPDEVVYIDEIVRRKRNMGGPITPGFATGGNVRGPGGVDRVPAMLTAGEFVIRKSSVDRLGMGLLYYMNEHGRLPGFARGGAVAASGSSLFASRQADRSLQTFAQATTRFASSVDKQGKSEKKSQQSRQRFAAQRSRSAPDDGISRSEWADAGVPTTSKAWLPYRKPKGAKKDTAGFPEYKESLRAAGRGVVFSGRSLSSARGLDSINRNKFDRALYTSADFESWNRQFEDRSYELEDASWQREIARYENDNAKTRVLNMLEDSTDYLDKIRNSKKYQDKDGKFIESKAPKKYAKTLKRVDVLRSRRRLLNRQGNRIDTQDWRQREAEREMSVDQRWVSRRQAQRDRENAKLQEAWAWDDTLRGLAQGSKEDYDAARREVQRAFDLGGIDAATLWSRTAALNAQEITSAAAIEMEALKDRFAALSGAVDKYAVRDLSWDGVKSWAQSVRDAISSSELDSTQQGSLQRDLDARINTLQGYANKLERIAKGSELKEQLIDAVGGSIDWGRTLNPASLSRSLTKQTALMNEYAANMTRLRESNLSEAALKRIAAMDPTQAAKFTRRLLLGGAGAINQFNSAVAGFEQSAEAVGDRGAAAAWAETGAQAAMGFAAGLQSQEESLRSAMQQVAESMLSAWKATLGIASPSRVFALAAREIPRGVVEGVEAEQALVDRAMRSMVSVPVMPRVPLAVDGVAGAGGGAGVAVTQNVYPTPGMSERQVADYAMKELMWQLGR